MKFTFTLCSLPHCLFNNYRLFSNTVLLVAMQQSALMRLDALGCGAKLSSVEDDRPAHEI